MVQYFLQYLAKMVQYFPKPYRMHVKTDLRLNRGLLAYIDTPSLK